MALRDELEAVAAAAAGFAEAGERLTGIVAAETLAAGRVYLCAFERADGAAAWLAVGADGAPVRDRRLVQEAASLAALCEVAEERAGGGDLDGLRARLAELRRTEAPAGIAEAEDAAAALADTVEAEPRVATTDYLDRLGAAAGRLEQALGDGARSAFAAALQAALPAVEELAADVVRRYKGPLS